MADQRQQRHGRPAARGCEGRVPFQKGCGVTMRDVGQALELLRLLARVEQAAALGAGLPLPQHVATAAGAGGVGIVDMDSSGDTL